MSASTTLGVDAVRGLVLEIGAVLDRVHAAGAVLGGLEPELIYTRPAPGGGVALTALAPRCLAFGAGARRPDYIVGPMFRTSHEAPELEMGEVPRPAADVYALCALAALWAPRAWPEVVAGGLERDPARRWGLQRVLEHVRR